MADPSLFPKFILDSKVGPLRRHHPLSLRAPPPPPLLALMTPARRRFGEGGGGGGAHVGNGGGRGGFTHGLRSQNQPPP